MKSIALVLAMFFVTGAQAQSDAAPGEDDFPQQMSARKLLDGCASSAITSAGRERRRYCAGFVSGVEEAVRHLQTQHRIAPSVCLPAGVSSKALSGVFIRYAAAKQRDMERPAAAVVLEALVDAYPCPAGKPDTEQQ